MGSAVRHVVVALWSAVRKRKGALRLAPRPVGNRACRYRPDNPSRPVGRRRTRAVRMRPMHVLWTMEGVDQTQCVVTMTVRWTVCAWQVSYWITGDVKTSMSARKRRNYAVYTEIV